MNNLIIQRNPKQKMFSELFDGEFFRDYKGRARRIDSTSYRNGASNTRIVKVEKDFPVNTL